MSSVTTQTMITARCIRNGSSCRKSSIITMPTADAAHRESSILCQHAVVCCWSPATEFLSTKL